MFPSTIPSGRVSAARAHGKSAATLPPGPQSFFGIGPFTNLRHDIIGYFTHLSETYGDITCFPVGPFPMFLVNNPKHIQDILVDRHSHFIKARGMRLLKDVMGEGLLTSDGNVHRSGRKIIQPDFRQSHIGNYVHHVRRGAGELDAVWENGGTIDCLDQMTRMTLANAGRCFLGTDLDGTLEVTIKTLTSSREFFDRMTNPFAVLLERLPLPSTLRMYRAKQQMHRLVLQLIQSRAQENSRGDDLLSSLLSIRSSGNQTISDAFLRDHLVTLLLTGHEKTALWLTWTWFLLAQHIQVERKLQDELRTVLGGRPPTIEDIEGLHFTRKVLRESLRMYPPVHSIARLVAISFRLGQYVLPRGATVYISPYVIHHDRRFYEDPWAFHPDRWTEEFERDRPACSFLPFGAGPRACIGEAFAWMQGTLALAILARTWRLVLVSGQEIVPTPLITLRPSSPIRMRLERYQ